MDRAVDISSRVLSGVDPNEDSEMLECLCMAITRCRSPYPMDALIYCLLQVVKGPDAERLLMKVTPDLMELTIRLLDRVSDLCLSGAMYNVYARQILKIMDNMSFERP